jgi:hypothetical protein
MLETDIEYSGIMPAGKACTPRQPIVSVRRNHPPEPRGRTVNRKAGAQFPAMVHPFQVSAPSRALPSAPAIVEAVAL